MKRKYAFGDTVVPREETSYMKVVYSAKHNFPPESICTEGGETFDRIFGANTSTLENFILIMPSSNISSIMYKFFNHCSPEFKIEIN